MRYSISGDIAQTVRLEPEPEETVWVSKRSLIAYSRGVEWTLKVPGGLEGAVRRTFAGEGVALTHLTVTGSGEHAVIGANSPGHVQVWDLADGAVVTTKGSFLGAWGEDIDIDVTVARRAGAAFFGGRDSSCRRCPGTVKFLFTVLVVFWSRIWRTVRRSPSAPGIWRHLPRVWTMTSRG